MANERRKIQDGFLEVQDAPSASEIMLLAGVVAAVVGAVLLLQPG